MAVDSAAAGKIIRQQTLKNSIHCSGVALHSGAKVNMVLHPAEADTGIVFRRTDAAGGTEVQALWRNAIETPLCTTLVDGKGNPIATIEHLMSALSACGIDNALVELNGTEVPIMAGSAATFVFLIECAGSVSRRTDAAGSTDMQVPLRNATETPRVATLVDGKGNPIATIEHLRSTLSACGIDNALVELNGPEVPIMDGSAAPVVFLIECAGVAVQASPRRALRVLHEVTVSEPHRSASLAPGGGFTVGFEIDFGDTLIGQIGRAHV